jgi:crotonobetainyl-CoA:carnitine CoA-transferase CaiB-like acyl-CoA transferase
VNLLNGIRVLDATSVLAGPLCTYLLALSGAEVTKVELPATGDFTRSIGPEAELNARKMGASFLAQNAGKHSITLNLKDEQGKDLFRRLSRNCDVVVENFRPGVMAGLGLGEQALRRENPGLIYCSISGFGQEGPLAGRPAYDHVIQGLAGGMTITGDEKTGPVKSGFQFCDTTAAMMAAYAITAALVRRERTGKGAFLDVAMPILPYSHLAGPWPTTWLRATYRERWGTITSRAVLRGLFGRQTGSSILRRTPKPSSSLSQGFWGIQIGWRTHDLQRVNPGFATARR